MELGFGLNAFGQYEFGNDQANRLYEDFLDKARTENDGLTSIPIECGCPGTLADTLKFELDNLYYQKESQLKTALKNELYLGKPIVNGATIEQLKSLITMCFAFQMEKAAKT